jgi:hypothetical protein
MSFQLGVLSGKPLNDTAADVQGKLGPIMSRAWRFWPFVHLVTYSVIPPAQRVLWVNCVDLVWSSILAGMASGTPPETAEHVPISEPYRSQDEASPEDLQQAEECSSSSSSSKVLKPGSQ